MIHKLVTIPRRTGTAAFRFQVELHVSGNDWHGAPGVVLFVENWFGRANRWGLLASGSF